VEIVAECNCVKTAFKAITDYNAQLVFLDIEMPNGNGFDLLRMFEKPAFKVIFVTAYSEYAIKAFRFSATDYLLKPVKIDELIEAVNKTKQELESPPHLIQDLKVLFQNLADNQHMHNLVIPDQKGFKVLNPDQIIMCEADGYCTIFYLEGNEKITSSKNLKHYEDFLTEYQFHRVNRAFLINLKHVKGYTKQGEIILNEKLSCPLGDNYKNHFLKIFNNLK
jgi:two-component system LytT family response regulator